MKDFIIAIINEIKEWFATLDMKRIAWHAAHIAFTFAAAASLGSIGRTGFGTSFYSAIGAVAVWYFYPKIFPKREL
jgi:hypothetical protein